MSAIGQSIQQAVAVIKNGGTLVYPTEAVFGLGCDYRKQQSVLHLLKLKQRPVSKGLILIASHVQQILPLIQPIHRDDLARALKSWPGHHTWVFPATEQVPAWITGAHQTVAVRVSQSPVVKALCDQLNHPIVSTSANLSGDTGDNDCQALQQLWGDQVDYYLDLPPDGRLKPSTIRVAHTGSTLR